MEWRELRPRELGEPASLPIKLSADRRYFVDQRDRPIFLHGDAGWSLIAGLTKSEADLYLEDRRRKGFNAILVNLIEHKFNGPANRDGEAPFHTEGDFDTPNERYFEHADWVIGRAREKGIVLLLAPFYLGYEGLDEGWFNEVLANGVEKCERYARFVARRYRRFDNIVWVMGGDRRPGRAMAHLRAMAAAIADEDEKHLRTAHLAPEVSTRDLLPNDSWLDFNLTYTYNLVHAMVLRDYYRTPIMPTVMIESYYEGEHNSTPQWIRRQAYWSLLNGAAGHVMGNRPIWGFFPGWQDALDSEGSISMMHFRTFLLSRPWHRFIPDIGLVIDGYGDPRTYEYVGAARSSDGSTAAIYIPTGRTIEVALGALAGDRITAWWYDPRTGRWADAGQFEQRRLVRFQTPSRQDWVLVLDASS